MSKSSENLLVELVARAVRADFVKAGVEGAPSWEETAPAIRWFWCERAKEVLRALDRAGLFVGIKP